MIKLGPQTSRLRPLSWLRPSLHTHWFLARTQHSQEDGEAHGDQMRQDPCPYSRSQRVSLAPSAEREPDLPPETAWRRPAAAHSQLPGQSLPGLRCGELLPGRRRQCGGSPTAPSAESGKEPPGPGEPRGQEAEWTAPGRPCFFSQPHWYLYVMGLWGL